MSATKMACPACGTLMNHHADKVDYEISLDDSSALNMEFGGVLQEIHYCPKCGETAVLNV
jgi:ribosomal protein S27AE